MVWNWTVVNAHELNLVHTHTIIIIFLRLWLLLVAPPLVLFSSCIVWVLVTDILVGCASALVDMLNRIRNTVRRVVQHGRVEGIRLVHGLVVDRGTPPTGTSLCQW